MAQQTTNDKLSLLKNRKVFLGVTSLLMGATVIFLFSFIPYTINPDGLRSKEFITDLLIICAIVILAMISAILIGQAGNAQNPKSRIAKSTVTFMDSKSRVVNEGLHKFKRWIQKVQQPNDIQTIKERILSEVGIEDATILKLNIEDIRSLLNTPKIINSVAYPSLTKEQLKTVIHIKQKGIDISLVPPEYYLNVKNILDNRTRTERASSEGAKKSLTLIFSVVSKLTTTIIFSVIFTIFVRDVASGQDVATAVTKLFSRLWSFCTSIFMGYVIGCQINDIDSEYIDMRVDTHLEFLEDKTFTVKSLKEELQDEITAKENTEQVLSKDNN